MPNGSLQEALFGSSSPLSWDRRFSIILDIAQALAFLHLECDPPVVHGDIKPSNVLLGFDFQAKISDFGLSRVKTEADLGPEFFSQDLGPSQELFKSQDEIFSFEHRTESGATLDDGRTESNGQWGKHWWWKQEGNGELSSKDYVREWIGTQICPSGNPDWDDEKRISPEKCFDFRNSSRVENLDVGDDTLFGDARDKNTEKKQGRKKGILAKRKWFRTISSREHTGSAVDDDARRGRELNVDISFKEGWKKKRSRSVGSDMFSGDVFSRELSSTTSMRGTVCYVAPECHGCERLMEKADIYSFGVLILVIVSGRRPLHVLSSPVKLEKANLVSWCRQLAQMGNLLELVDERLKSSYNKEQAGLCINLALLCLQRIPELRPDSGDVVKILEGEMELPVVPCEFSPSPNARHLSRSRRKASMEVE
ncbi:STYKc [Musa troglodytarum]|uniref:STYKc n=1 Tax=Musa troglodytarum TaxID=320322 RepID=A0A9E7HXM3_9LILI|nr:STYKc [Musa troglodytarum]